MSDKKSDIVMQGQNGDFRGGNCEEKKPKLRRFDLGQTR